MSNKTFLVIGGIVLLAILATSSFYIVDERKQALLLAFGEVQSTEKDPGLKFKLPSPLNTATLYEKRIMSLSTNDLEVTPIDDRRLVVDAFALWRITDLVRFRQAVQTEQNAQQRLEGIMVDALRKVLGRETSDSVLSDERTRLMNEIRDTARLEAQSLGVTMIDVRILRADLPQENLEATYERMKSEREREAADERARGREAAQRVRARADRDAIELVSDARREADIVRGRADARRNEISIEAYSRDPEFFAFYRSLNAYKQAIQSDNSTMVISPDSTFFDYLNSDNIKQ